MADFNQTIIAGRLTADPELRYTNGKTSTSVAEYIVAVNRRFGNNVENLFMTCVTFGKQAETVSRYLSKGSSVLISGYLRQESWTTKNGEKRNLIKLVTESINFLEKPQKAEKPAENATPSYNGHKYPPSDVPQSNYEEDTF